MRILLADDHKMMRDGLRAIIAQEEGFDVVGEAANGHEAVALARRLKPQVVIMDISMPELNGIDATRRMLADRPSLKVFAVSMNSDRNSVLQMFAAGAVGYLLKSCAADELLFALKAVAQGHKYVSPKVTGIMVDQLTGAHAGEDKPGGGGPRALSSREREVLQLVAEGKSTKEISECMHIAVATVDTHRRQIMDKLGLRTVAELTKYAVREGLTSLS